MDNKLRKIEEIVESYYAGNYIPVTPASWYFERFRLCLSTIKRLTEENTQLKDANAELIKSTHEVGNNWEKGVMENIQLTSLLRQKQEEIESLNKRYLEEFEKKHD